MIIGQLVLRGMATTIKGDPNISDMLLPSGVLRFSPVLANLDGVDLNLIVKLVVTPPNQRSSAPGGHCPRCLEHYQSGCYRRPSRTRRQGHLHAGHPFLHKNPALAVSTVSRKNVGLARLNVESHCANTFSGPIAQVIRRHRSIGEPWCL